MRLPELHTDLGSLPESINDLKDKYFDGSVLSEEERLALHNFDKFRMEYLNASADEREFEKRYLEIQAKANLSSYREFLNLDKLKSLNGL